MINVSSEFKQVMQERTDFRCYADVTLADETVLHLDDSVFTIGGNGFTDGAGANGLPLGVAVGRSIKISIMNDDGEFDDYAFFGASIHLYLTFALSQTTEQVEIGHFTVVSPETKGSVITITGNDDMYRAEIPYTTQLSFPATLSQMFVEACTACGITYATATFRNSTFTVSEKPAGVNTFRDLFGYIAAIAGGNARISRSGNMEIITYDFSAGASRHNLASWESVTIDTDDITITGIKTTVSVEADDENDESSEQEYICGDDGYVLAIENPLIAGHEQAAVNLIGAVLVGKSFRKFDGNYIGYPIAEFGDLATITDAKGNQYSSVITDIDFSFGGLTKLSNSAESVVGQSIPHQSAAARTIAEAKKLVAAERSARQAAVDNFNQQMDGSGLYRTAVTLPDHSVVFYLHDKPDIEDSQIIIKVTSNAIGVSNDGGSTYKYGFTVNGQMIAGILSAEGINADWINAGTIGADRLDIGGDVTIENGETKVKRLEVVDPDNSNNVVTIEDGVACFYWETNGTKYRAVMRNGIKIQVYIEDRNPITHLPFGYVNISEIAPDRLSLGITAMTAIANQFLDSTVSGTSIIGDDFDTLKVCRRGSNIPSLQFCTDGPNTGIAAIAAKTDSATTDAVGASLYKYSPDGSHYERLLDTGNTAPENVNIYAASGAPIDSTKTSYTAKYFPILGMTFLRIYAQTNATISPGADVNILAIGTTHKPGTTHALAVRSAKNMAASIDSEGYIRVRAYESVSSGYDIHITGWIYA